MIVSKITNNYSFGDKLQLGYWWFLTKLFNYRSRLIRRPFTIRGREMIDFGTRLTTGVGCRIEAFRTKDDKKIRKKKIRFGNRVQLNDYVHISAIESVSIGDDVLIASHIYISDNSHGSYKSEVGGFPSSPEIAPCERPYFVLPVKIGNRVWWVKEQWFCLE